MIRPGCPLAVSILLAAPLFADPSKPLTPLEPLKPAQSLSDKPADDKTDLTWYDAKHLPIEGKGWTDTAEFWHRLPARARGVVRGPVWNLSTNSAGICVRFITDADKIFARWTVTSPNLALPHMPATGVSGLDLYVRHQGRWHWVGAGRPGSSVSNEAALVQDLPTGRHEYMLYLPLYNGTKSLELGIPAAAALFSPPVRQAKPIVVYGTSICQGGCASRPGMAHIAIVGRRLDWPTINLGFSGNGKMEPEMANFLAELDPAVYVLDCLPNMTPDMVAERVEPFVKTLRKAHPDTPILLVEQAPHQAGTVLPGRRELVTAKNTELKKAHTRLTADQVPGLTYVPGDNLLGHDGDATVDGSHPTDLGFARMADILTPVLRRVLTDE